MFFKVLDPTESLNKFLMPKVVAHYGKYGKVDDYFTASKYTDKFYGGYGSDTVDYSNASQGLTINLSTGMTSGAATSDKYFSIENITGTNYNDFIVGNNANNTIIGGKGNDYLEGKGGSDVLKGGSGDDELTGGAGKDYLYGQDNDDILKGGSENDQLFGGAGNDNLFGESGADWIDGGAGIDTISFIGNFYDETGVTVNLITGLGSGGTAQGDRYINIENVTGSFGDDHIIGNEQDNVLIGSNGDDILEGNGGNDTFIAGDDYITLELVDGQIVFAGHSSDSFDGGSGIDHVDYSNLGVDNVDVDLSLGYGNAGETLHDTYISIENITGTVLGDKIVGNNAANTLDGYFGDDEINGAGGNDVLIGGQGADTFVFANNDGRGPDFGHGNDIIKDFETGIDKIDLSDTEVRNFNSIDDQDGNYYMDDDGNGGTIIYTLDGQDGDSITVEGVAYGTLTVDDFIF